MRRRDSGRARCRASSPASTFRRPCTGRARAASASSGPFAGWWHCSVRMLFLSKWQASAAATRTYGHRILGAQGPTPRHDRELRRAASRQLRPREGRRTDSNELKQHWAAMFEPDADLLKTLVYLTEWPTPIRGSFDPAYLELPKEILSTVMRHHQRYFSVLEAGWLAGAGVCGRHQHRWRSRRPHPSGQ